MVAQLNIVNKDVGRKKRIIVSNTHLLVVERTYLFFILLK